MTDPSRVAVVTIVRGRHEHLRGQLWGLARQVTPPDLHVVVSMGDPEIALVAPHATIVELPPSEELPLAEARNAGARAAMDAGADVLVFLDVDCIPSPALVRRYAEVVRPADRSASTAEPTDGPARPVVACGVVSYLPPTPHPADYRHDALAGLSTPHRARPAPDEGAVEVAEDVRLFWSLSFATTAADWTTLGGFCEDYIGYGGEDTDFGQRIVEADGTMLWVGGAAAYHQHHPVEAPPVRHLASIVRNANVFHDRWGWFPMEGWLAEFAHRGLAEIDGTTGRWRTTG